MAELIVSEEEKAAATYADTTVTVRGCTKNGVDIGDWAVNIKRLDT